jgi:hypothetical protein
MPVGGVDAQPNLMSLDLISGRKRGVVRQSLENGRTDTLSEQHEWEGGTCFVWKVPAELEGFAEDELV